MSNAADGQAATPRRRRSDYGAAGAVIRVAVVGQEQCFVEALALALDAEPDLASAGTALTPWDARSLLSGGIDVAIIVIGDAGAGLWEVSGPGGTVGVALAAELAAAFPSVKLLVLGETADPEALDRAIGLGALGYLPKASSLREVVDALRAVHRDHAVAPSRLLKQVLGKWKDRQASVHYGERRKQIVSERELQVLRLMAAGLSTGDMAGKLFLSINTVRSHVQSTLSKLGAHTRLEAVALAREAGLLQE